MKLKLTLLMCCKPLHTAINFPPAYLQTSHHVQLLMLDGNLFKAPIDAKPQRALDVGTGTGIWAMYAVPNCILAQFILLMMHTVTSQTSSRTARSLAQTSHQHNPRKFHPIYTGRLTTPAVNGCIRRTVLTSYTFGQCTAACRTGPNYTSRSTSKSASSL